MINRVIIKGVMMIPTFITNCSSSPYGELVNLFIAVLVNCLFSISYLVFFNKRVAVIKSLFYPCCLKYDWPWIAFIPHLLNESVLQLHLYSPKYKCLLECLGSKIYETLTLCPLSVGTIYNTFLVNVFINSTRAYMYLYLLSKHIYYLLIMMKICNVKMPKNRPWKCSVFSVYSRPLHSLSCS